MTSILLTEDICQSMTSEIVTKLNEIKISSVKIFLSSDLTKIFRSIRNKHINFKKLLQIRNELNLKFGPKKYNAFDVYKNVVKNQLAFKTGINKFDEMIESGIRTGEVTEIYGYSDCGKTQFCYTFALNLSQKYNRSVLFIDTDLSFSHKRIKEIVSNRYQTLFYSETEDILSLIKVMTVLDMTSLLQTIETISNDLETNPKSKFKDIKVVIIDSLSTILKVEFSRNSFEAEVQELDKNNSTKASEYRFRSMDLLSQIAFSLNTFAIKHSIAVIVVNSESVNLKNNWKHFCRLSLNFFKEEKEDTTSDNKVVSIGIKITRSYDKSIENKSFNDFQISCKGFHSNDVPKELEQ